MNNDFDNNINNELETEAECAEEQAANAASQIKESDAPQEKSIISGAEDAKEENAADYESDYSEKDKEEFSDNANESGKSYDAKPGFTVTHREIKKNKHTFLKVVALALVAGIVGGSAFGVANTISTRVALSNVSIGTTEVALTKSDSANDGMSSISSIANSCMPSIVAITNRSMSDVMTFFGTYSQESTSTGSGIIIGKNDSELLIVTNYHVIANSKELSVIFSSVESKLEAQDTQSDIQGASGSTKSDIASDNSIPNATVKGYNSDKDLAVIAVSLKDIPSDVLSEIKVAVIGDSSKLKAGDQVVAIGNALGYGQSVTTGIISATNRKITMDGSSGDKRVTNSFIQTDAAINPGNSGGALLNMAGEVIGINSVKIASSGVEGMGYAIPITDVSNIIDELMVKKTRSVVDEKEQGFLGITGADVSSSASQTYGIPTGVFVNSVMEGLGAEKAGIKRGYVITKFDGYTISTIVQLQDRLTYYKAGEKVSVTVEIPDGASYKEEEITVTLSKRSEATKDIKED